MLGKELTKIQDSLSDLRPIQASYVDAVSSGMVEKPGVPKENHRLQIKRTDILSHARMYPSWIQSSPMRGTMIQKSRDRNKNKN